MPGPAEPPGTSGLELRMAQHTVRRAIVVGPVLVAIAALWRGRGGALAAAIGVAIVVGYFLLSGAMLTVAARISLGAYHAAALLGFFMRLGLIALSMIVVAALVDIDRPALGITVVVAFLTLLAWEAVAVAKGRERELEWIS